MRRTRPLGDKRHLKTTQPWEIELWRARHKSKHVEPTNDGCTVALFDNNFLRDIEGNGTRRKVMADLGFDMDPGHPPVETERLDLGKGYVKFNRALKELPGGLHEPIGFEEKKGEGCGTFFIQGERNAE